MRRLLLGICLSLLLALLPSTGSAQLGLGPQLSWGDDYDLALGARLTLGLPGGVPLEVSGSFDFFFPDPEGVDYWELNANIYYFFQLPTLLWSPYAGGGFNIAHVDVETPVRSFDNTELGINLLGGIKYLAGPVTPYGELRIELDGGDQVVIAFGVLFNIGPGL